jgi:AcrR family transcriptional regulator
MARPPTITDDEVLAAARAVFLDRGITATVLEVAERCGVGEATVFRRFPTKQALFLAAVEGGSEPEWEQILSQRWPSWKRTAPNDVPATLHALAEEMLASGRKMFPLLVMKLSNPAFLTDAKRSPRVTRTLEILSRFFEEQIAHAGVPELNPRVAARIWLGAIQHLVLFETLPRAPEDPSPEEFIDGMVDLFANALTTSKGARR